MAETKIKTIKDKVGLPPGSLIHIGELKQEHTELTLIKYDESDVSKQELSKVEPFSTQIFNANCNWLSVTGLNEVSTVDQVGRELGIHLLDIEDILNTNQRPKADSAEGYLFLVVNSFSIENESLKISKDQVSLILGKNFVVSFEERSSKLFDAIKDRIGNGLGRVRQKGNDYLFYLMFDTIVDNYSLLIEKIGDNIYKLENDVIKNRFKSTDIALKKVLKFRKDIIYLRKNFNPLREVFGKIERSHPQLINDETAHYLSDIHDHVVQALDNLDSYRETLNNILEIHLSHSSNKLNQIMKVLTIMSTIFIPLTFLAGIYGMNFEYMPELHMKLAYPTLLLSMVIIVGFMMFYFRRKDWL